MKETLEEWIDGKEAELNQWDDVHVVMFDGHRGMVMIGQGEVEVVELEGEVSHDVEMQHPRARGGGFTLVSVDKSCISGLNKLRIDDGNLVAESNLAEGRLTERLTVYG